MSKNKHQDLQPWLDYFKMLQQYEQKGFLQMNPKEHEVYITRAAFCSLSPDPSPVERGGTAANDIPLQGGTRWADILFNLRAYAGWKAVAADPSAISHQPSYISAPFAVHIVKEEYPHDLLLTLLLQQKRSWRTAWRTVDTIEAIDYTEKMKSEE